MRKWKRLLSVFLAGVLALSATTVAFAAGTSPEEIEKEIDKIFTSSANLLDEELKPVALAQNYRALKAEEKDAMKAVSQARVMEMAMRGGQKLYTKETGNAASKMTEEDYLSYSAKVIGDLTEDQLLARKLFCYAYGKEEFNGVKLTSSTKFVASGSVTEEQAQKNRDLLAELNKTYTQAPENVRELAQLFWHSGYAKPAASGYFYALSGLLTLNVNLVIQQKPYKNLSDEEKAKYGNNENGYKEALFKEAMHAGFLTKTQLTAMDTAIAVADAYDYYYANNYSEDKLVKALADYDAMGEAEKLVVDKLTTYMVACYSSPANYKKGTVTFTSYRTMIGYCRNAVKMDLVRDFVAYIDSIKKPYTNDHVKESRVELDKVIEFLVPTIPEKTMEKYNDIQDSYQPILPLVPSDEKPDVSKWTPGEPDYAYNVNETRAEDALAGLTDYLPVILELVGVDSLQTLLEDGVYTNATATQLIKLVYNDVLYPVIIDAGYGFIAGTLISPDAIAKTIGEEKFAGIKAKMVAAGKQMENWSTIVAESGDWGFEDGDQDGFFQAVTAGLRKLLDIATNGYKILGMGIDPIIKFANYKNSDGDYFYGAYEDLIPVLEGLGLEGIMSSKDYSEAFDAGTGNAKYDNLLLPILRPIGKLIDKIAADPVNTLMDLLPRAARLIESGELDSSLQKVLGRITAFQLPELDFSADGINTMIEGIVSGIVLGANEETGAAGVALQYTPIDWKALGSMGTMEVAKSVRASNLYFARLNSNRGDATALVLDYVAKMVVKNADAIDALLGTIPEAAALLPILRPIYTNEMRLTGIVYDLLAPAREVLIQDEESSITVKADTSIIPENAQLSVKAVGFGSVYNGIDANLKDVAERFQVYDIALTSDGKETRVDGRVYVMVPMQYDASRTMMYQADETGKLTALSWSETDKAASIHTHEMGYFVMAQAKKDVEVPPVVDPEDPTVPTDPTNPSDPSEQPGGDNNQPDGDGTVQIPQTGDKVLSAFAALSMAAGAAYLFSLKSKKRG